MSREHEIATRVVEAIFRQPLEATYEDSGDVESISALGYSLDRDLPEEGEPADAWTLSRVVYLPGDRETPPDWDAAEVARGRFATMLTRLVQEAAKEIAEGVLEAIGLEELYQEENSDVADR